MSKKHENETVDRAHGARLLRAARAASSAPNRAGSAAAAEAIAWAYATMPDRRCPQRLQIQQLIEAADYESADAILAQCLLQRPDEANLITLRARSLAAQLRFEAADAELQAALAARPKHVATLRLAACIAGRVLDHARAASLFLRALEQHPHDESIRHELADSLLVSGDADAAEMALWHTYDAPPLLRARILRGQGRLLDAAALLEPLVAATPEPGEELLLELIDLLEELGRPPRIRPLLDRVAGHQEHAMIRAGLVRLSLGDFDEAVRSLTPLLRTARRPEAVAAILIVASVMLNRPRRAKGVLAACGLGHADLDQTVLTNAWRRGMLGRTILAQMDPRAGDPSVSMLRPLLESAVDTFEMELRKPADLSPQLSEEQRLTLEVHLSTCLRALDKAGEPSPPIPSRRPRKPVTPSEAPIQGSEPASRAAA